MDNVWIENMRQISMQAVEAGRPCDVMQGTVVSATPLAVRIDQKTTVTGNQLLVPQYLTDHAQQMSIPGVGIVSAAIKNALKAGDTVILVQKRGAQQYLVVDRY